MTQHASYQDIIDAFADLDDDEKRAIHNSACKHLGGTRFSMPLDLVHEALYLALQGRRRWPVGLDFSVFLQMTIRSVAYADRTVSSNAKTVKTPVEDILEWSEVGAPHHPSAEECAQKAQCNQIAWRKVASARERLASCDPIAARALDGLVAEAPACELRRDLGLCAAELDAVRKRVLRALRNTGRL
jgi:DNA-directed RNA polymerase specialized sigma24 family protein